MDGQLGRIATRLRRGGGIYMRDDLPVLRRYLEGFIPPDRLVRDQGRLSEWVTTESDPLFVRSFLDRPDGISLVIAGLWGARQWEQLEEPPSRPRLGHGVEHVIRFAGALAVLESHAPKAFDTAAREYLGQRLAAEHEALGVAHEIATSDYFIRKGARVDPRFLIKASEDEVLLEWEGMQVPVQCKAKPPGAGDPIADQTFTRLTSSIARDIGAAGSPLKVGIHTTGRFDPQHVGGIREAFRRGVGRRGPEIINLGGRTFMVAVEQISRWVSSQEASRFLDSQEFDRAMLVAEPWADSVPLLDRDYQVKVLVGVRSSARVYPWSTLRSSIDDAERQLRAGPPGIVAIHFADHVADPDALVADESTLRGLRPDGGREVPLRPGENRMRVAIRWKCWDWPHVAAVMISSEPDFRQSGKPGRVRTYRAGGDLPQSLWDCLGERVA